MFSKYAVIASDSYIVEDSLLHIINCSMFRCELSVNFTIYNL